MNKKFPASPYRNHRFLPFPESGNLYTETGEDGWVVVLQRDGDIRGPMPALQFVPVQRGVPGDVIGYHLMDAEEAKKINADWIAKGKQTDIVSTRASRTKEQIRIGLATALILGAAAAALRKRS